MPIKHKRRMAKATGGIILLRILLGGDVMLPPDMKRNWQPHNGGWLTG